MNIRVNGKQQEFDARSLNVTELLKGANVENPEMVSVQVNGEFVDKKDFVSTLLKGGDEVDFLYFMGGGTGGDVWVN